MTYQYGQDPGVAYEDRAMPAIVYVLYILGLFHGLTLIIGLVMAYGLRGTRDPPTPATTPIRSAPSGGRWSAP